MAVNKLWWPILLLLSGAAYTQTGSHHTSVKTSTHVAVKQHQRKVAVHTNAKRHRKVAVHHTNAKRHRKVAVHHTNVKRHRKVAVHHTNAKRHRNVAVHHTNAKRYRKVAVHHTNAKRNHKVAVHTNTKRYHKVALRTHAATTKHHKAIALKHPKTTQRRKPVHAKKATHHRARAHLQTLKYVKTKQHHKHLTRRARKNARQYRFTKYARQHRSNRKHHGINIEFANFLPQDIKLPKLTMPYQTGSHLLEQVDVVLHNMHYTHYQYGGNRFDLDRGVFKIDCSHYVDQLVANANPIAYNSMKRWTGSVFPASRDYYAFIKQLPYNKVAYNWYHISAASRLAPGDVIVYRKSGKRHSSGHVMIVTSVPKRDPRHANIYHVMVSDSASSGHGTDTRRYYGSGVGVGTILFRVDPETDIPTGFSWSEQARWRNYAIAMARPIA